MQPLVFLVDDNASVRSIIEVRLSIEGYRVASAARGREALETLQDLSPSLIILDYRMPGMSGLEVAQHLSCDERLAAVPIMMLTASVSLGVVEMARKLKLAAYMVKPFTLDALADRVNRLVYGPKTNLSIESAPQEFVELDF